MGYLVSWLKRLSWRRCLLAAILAFPLLWYCFMAEACLHGCEFAIGPPFPFIVISFGHESFGTEPISYYPWQPGSFLITWLCWGALVYLGLSLYHRARRWHPQVRAMTVGGILGLYCLLIVIIINQYLYLRLYWPTSSPEGPAAEMAHLAGRETEIMACFLGGAIFGGVVLLVAGCCQRPRPWLALVPFALLCHLGNSAYQFEMKYTDEIILGTLKMSSEVYNYRRSARHTAVAVAPDDSSSAFEMVMPPAEGLSPAEESVRMLLWH
jgi:hypothetical protein